MGTTHYDALDIAETLNATEIQVGGVAIPATADLDGVTDGGNADLLHDHTLTGITDAGTAADEDVGYFGTFAQGGLADSAVQPGDLASVATLGTYASLASGKPTLGTAAAQNVGYFGTFAQGGLADSAVQPGDIGTAAAVDTGTGIGDALLLETGGKLPAVDGSQLTNLPSPGDPDEGTIHVVGEADHWFTAGAQPYIFKKNSTGGALTLASVPFAVLVNADPTYTTETITVQLISWQVNGFTATTRSAVSTLNMPTGPGTKMLMSGTLGTITAIPDGHYYGVQVTGDNYKVINQSPMSVQYNLPA